jgi:DNA gyrase subunit B
MDFENGGKIKTRLEVRGKAPRDRTGTTVRFWPDPAIFEELEFRAQTLLERFQMMAFLNAGLEIRFVDKRPAGNPEPVVFKYAGGIKDFVKHINETKEPIFKTPGYFEQSEEDQEVEIAFQWNTGYQTDGLHSFANGINTIEGGMHVEGFRKALTNVVNRYARAKGLLKEKDDNLQGEDIREGLTAIRRCGSATRSSKVRPRASSATCRCGRSSSEPPTRSWPTGSRSTPPRPARS